LGRKVPDIVIIYPTIGIIYYSLVIYYIPTNSWGDLALVSPILKFTKD